MLTVPESSTGASASAALALPLPLPLAVSSSSSPQLAATNTMTTNSISVRFMAPPRRVRHYYGRATRKVCADRTFFSVEDGFTTRFTRGCHEPDGMELRLRHRRLQGHEAAPAANLEVADGNRWSGRGDELDPVGLHGRR